MSHKVETIAYAGQTPWHGIGVRVEAGATVAAWAKAAKMTWSVDTAPVLFDVGGEISTVVGAGRVTEPQEFEGRNVVYRKDTKRPFAVVSDRYNIVQPKEILEYFRKEVEVLGSFEMETLGVLEAGAKIWGLARSKKGQFNIGTKKHNDEVQRYLLLATSYDLSMPTIRQQTSVCVVCWNTLMAAFRDGSSQFRISHVQDFEQEIQKQKALEEEWSKFAELAEQLAEKPVTEADSKEFLLDVFYTADVRASKSFSEKGAARKLALVESVVHNGAGQDLPSRKGTLWGLVNGVTNYIDHAARSRTAERRLSKAFFAADGAGIKNRAFQLAVTRLG